MHSAADTRTGVRCMQICPVREPLRDRTMLTARLLIISAVMALLPGAQAPAGLHRDSPVPVTPAAATSRTPLPFHYDLYTFRGRGGSTAIVTAFAVEAGNLETESVGDRARYRFSVTLVLADTVLRTVSNTHDTVFVDVPRSFPDDHVLHTHVEVRASPSGSTRQRVVMTDATTPGIGQLYSEVFPIPDYNGSELMLSDIALGRPGASNGWRRGDVTLALLPTSLFPAGAFDVYYEVYNLPGRHAYTTEIAVQRLNSGGGKAGDPVRLRFNDESTAGRDDMLAELRRVDASLGKGSYRLTVTVTDRVTGASAVQHRDFDIRDDDRQATMVAAQRSGARD